MMFGNTLLMSPAGGMDLNQPIGLLPPGGSGFAPLDMPQPVAPVSADPSVQTQPQQPYVWAQGGKRMTPAEIALAHKHAQDQIAAGSDYSPVGHWTQGLARVAQALVGGMEEKHAQKAAAANAAESDAVAQALMHPGEAGQSGASAQDRILAALTNPYVGDQVHDVARTMWDREYEANKPQYFSGGQDRVKFDPTSGQATTIYDAPSNAEAYANNFGAPGSDEYRNAMRDYTLRGWGPSAVDAKGDLNDERFQQRLTLKGTPTYHDTHPTVHTPAPQRPTMSGTIAGVLNKVAAGGSLSPGEQDIYNSWRNGKRGNRAGPGGASGIPRVNSPAEAANLPPGTSFMTPDGQIRIRH